MISFIRIVVAKPFIKVDVSHPLNFLIHIYELIVDKMLYFIFIRVAKWCKFNVKDV